MRVMTRNLYLGASLDPILGAGSAEELPARVDEVWDEALRSDPPARLAAIAAELRAEAPDVVALQEVARWDAAAASFDFLALLLAAAPGWRAAAVATTFAGALPGARAGLVSLEDRAVLLVRDGVSADEAHAAPFAACARIPIAGLELAAPRGYATAVVTAGRCRARVVGVHLELAHLPPLAAIQRAQADELAAVAAGPLPVVVAGDLNARPGAGAHAALVAAGLVDAWAAVHPGDSGFTCCEDRTLANERSTVSERIDHVLVRGLAARRAVRTGGVRSGGRWPSDHRGVVVDLEGEE